MAEDIIYGVLSRLPIKSLVRFQSVSKSWLKYINDPHLRTIHVKEEPTPIMFQQIPCFGLTRTTEISFLRGMQKEPVLELCYKGLEHGFLILGGSCNGLTLVSCEQEPCYDGTYRFAVINPVSKQRHDLPAVSIKIDRSSLILIEDDIPPAIGIGFDDSTNTFKTVFSVVTDPLLDVVCTMVHSSGTSSWREIAQTPPYAIEDIGVFGHGRLHWVGSELYNDSSSPKYKIMWFDVKTEELGLMDVPPSGDNIVGYELVDLNGEVGCIPNGPTSYTKVWILKQEEWVLHCVIDVSALILLKCYYDEVDVLGCWNKDGDILLTIYNDRERWFVYTLKTGHLQEVEHHVPCKGRIQMYQSSLFSVLTSPYSIKNRSVCENVNPHVRLE